MTGPLSFLRRWFSRERNDGVIQIFTPQAASERGAGAKLALAGVTVVGLAVGGVVALASLAWLFAAVGLIYFLLTQVLGIRLDVDPAAFVRQAQQYAQYSRN